MNSFGFSLPSVSDAVGSGDREGLSFLKVKVNHRTLFFFFGFFVIITDSIHFSAMDF